MTAILTRPGRAALAAAVRAKTLYIAWGSGNPAWGTNPPDPPVTTAALYAELGRRVATVKDFVTPDEAGEIETPSGERFTYSASPTQHLLVRANFAYGDSPTATIREVGVFTDTVLDTGLPPSQSYFPPADVADIGLLLVYERRPQYARSIATRETIEFVITF